MTENGQEGLDSLRSDVQTLLEDVVCQHGPKSPAAQVLGHVLLRGDARSMRAALAMYRTAPDAGRRRITAVT